MGERHGDKKKEKSFRRSNTVRKLPTSSVRKGSRRKSSRRRQSEMTEEEKEEAREKRRQQRTKQIKQNMNKVKKGAMTAAHIAIAFSNKARFEMGVATQEHADQGDESRRQRRRSSVSGLAALQHAGASASRPNFRRNSSVSQLQFLRLSATKGPDTQELAQAAKELEDRQRKRTHEKLLKKQKEK